MKARPEVVIRSTPLYGDMTMAGETKTERQYRMRKRLEDVDETRRRIVEATVELHGSVGPSKTTVSAVADLAGVQRSTVYRHYPDDEALFGACTSHWLAQHPWPRPQDWESEPDPRKRLASALRELYRYYDENRAMLGNSYRDIDVMPSFVGEMMRAQLQEMHQVLVDGWRDSADRRRIAAAVHHALDFRAWSSLDDAGLGSDQAAALMRDMVLGVVGTA